MDLGFSEEQEMLKKMAREFLAKECPKSYVRAMEEDERGYSEGVWKKIAELGWLGLAYPERYGGGGGSFLDLAVLLEEMGRALFPGPFFSTVVLGGMAVLVGGSEEQKARYLSGIARGEVKMTLALTEPSGTWEAGGVKAKVKREGEGYIIDGVKLFVPDGQVADYLVTVCREAGSRGERGISLLLVPAKSPGVSVTALSTIASDKQSEVEYRGVRVGKEALLGKEGEGWGIVKEVLEYAAAGKSVEMVGGAQQVLEMTVGYAKERVQFGRPIGSFQAVQHHCANMAIDVDGSRFVSYQAAWMLGEGMEAEREVSIAKAWVSDAYRRVCALGHQVHGGIGFTKDHDMQLYYRRAKAGEVLYGDGDYHREQVARLIGI